MDPRLPFVSSSSVTISNYSLSGAGSAPVSFDSSKFMNTYRVPIEIRELSIVTEYTRIDMAAGIISAPNHLYLSMKVGRHFMTDNFVPIAVIAPYKVDAGRGDSANSFTSSESYLIGAATFSSVSVRRLLFPSPIVLRPGQGFGFQTMIPAQAGFAGSPASLNATVKIAMIGRYLSRTDSIPSKTQIPMISFVELSQASRFSDETELRNPLDSTLRVHHLIQSRWNASADGGSTFAADFAFGLPAINTIPPTLALRFPNGDPLLPDVSVFPTNAVFSQMNVVPIRFDMPRACRIQATLGQPSAAESTAQFYQISLFGTREESL